MTSPPVQTQNLAPLDDGSPLPPADGARDFKDLGFGKVVAQQLHGRFLEHDGTPRGRKYGLGPQRLERLYLAALAVPLRVFVTWALGIMLLLNGVFALAYQSLGAGALAGGDGVGINDPFLRALSFSVGVFTTTGTTPMYAVGGTAHWLVIFESFVGIFVLVAAAGLLIARLTRPRMRLAFSESAVIAPYEKGRGLMFRIVNALPGELTDVRVRFSLSMWMTYDGKRERDFFPLKLERTSVDLFNLHWTVVHPIDEQSPIRGFTPELLREAEAELLVLVQGHEETFSTNVTARASYWWDEITWDAKFASIFAHSADDAVAIDVERLSRLDRLPEGTTKVPSPFEGAAVR
ncbi:MAG: transporter [Gemmatimonadaceae bacterium]